jgi:hypothetical protein
MPSYAFSANCSTEQFALKRPFGPGGALAIVLDQAALFNGYCIPASPWALC